MQNLILCPGLPRSGSTSLWRLLSSNDSIVKEPHYLFGLYNFDSTYPSLYPDEVVEEHKQCILERNKRLFNLELPYSFNDYTHYINKGLLDFSQSYWLLSEDCLNEIKQSLPHFNIKIVLLYREPVQRLYSYCNMIYNDWNCNDSPRELFDKYVYDCDTLYSDVNDKFRRVFDDVICLSTEKFFGSQKECNILTDFIEMKNIEMVNIHENSIEYNPLSNEDIKRAQELLRPSCDFHAKL